MDSPARSILVANSMWHDPALQSGVVQEEISHVTASART
jgi:hypothetical protein